MKNGFILATQATSKINSKAKPVLHENLIMLISILIYNIISLFQIVVRLDASLY